MILYTIIQICIIIIIILSTERSESVYPFYKKLVNITTKLFKYRFLYYCVKECFSKDQVVIIDHVYDAVTDKVSKLINPYIVVIQQDEVLESYKLKHLKVTLWNWNFYSYTYVHYFSIIFVYYQMVNSEVKEMVFNKDSTKHYPGCYTDLKRSNCNATIAEKVTPMQYSEVYDEIYFL